jgi:hypothetical protein
VVCVSGVWCVLVVCGVCVCVLVMCMCVSGVCVCLMFAHCAYRRSIGAVVGF